MQCGFARKSSSIDLIGFTGTAGLVPPGKSGFIPSLQDGIESNSPGSTPGLVSPSPSGRGRSGALGFINPRVGCTAGRLEKSCAFPPMRDETANGWGTVLCGWSGQRRSGCNLLN